jgi:hypothetical protein
VERDETYRRNYQAYTFEPGEVMRGSCTASQGMLVITNRRLLYEPMRTPKGLIEPASDALGFGSIGKLITGAIDLSGGLREAWEVSLSEIASVEPDGSTHLRVRLRSGESHRLEIASGLWSPRFSSTNREARDEFVETLRMAVSAPGMPRPSQMPGPIEPARPLSAADAVAFLVGRWKVTAFPEAGDWGTLVLNGDGRFTGAFVMFGGRPEGSPVDGIWWLGEPGRMLVVQGRVTEVETDQTPIVLPVQFMVWFDEVTPNHISGELFDGEKNRTTTLTRVT